MKDSFEKSNFKSLTALAEAVKSNKATISRLYNGTSQTLTNKPSQPNRDLVLRLADAFQDDLNKVLVLAGYAPTSTTNIPDELTGLFHGAENWSPKKRKAIIKKIQDEVTFLDQLMPDDDEEERDIDYLNH